MIFVIMCILAYFTVFWVLKDHVLKVLKKRALDVDILRVKEDIESMVLDEPVEQRQVQQSTPQALW